MGRHGGRPSKLDVQSSRGRLHRFRAIDFPGTVLGDEAVEKAMICSAAIAEEDLHDGRRAARFHKAKLDSLAASDFSVIAPDQGLVLRRSELLLHTARSLAIDAGVIGGAE